MRDNLGAFVEHVDVTLVGAESGPLSGLTFAAKDLFDIAGHRTGCGNPDWLRTHPPAGATAPIVETLVSAGATCVGKTHTDELAFSLNGENHHYGTPRNVNAPGRIPGGSSSGSAAAVAGGLVDFAIGTDTGGSVRVPASYCGTFGLRSTHGRIPLDGVMPLAPHFDTIGWFARSADVMQQVGRVALPEWAPPERPGGLLVPEDAWSLADASVFDALQHPLRDASRIIGGRQDITLSNSGLGAWFTAFRILQGAEIWQVHRDWIERTDPAFGPGIAERFRWVATITPDEVAEAERVRSDAADALAGLLDGGAVIALPTAPGVAPPRQLPSVDLEAYRYRALQLTAIAGLARLPQISIPAARVDGCPVGLSIVGPRGADELLLELAGALAAAPDQSS